jgi:hypothetical protein
VLYEMLTGQCAFKGDNICEIMVAIFRNQPAFMALPAGTPATVRTTLARCLQKDRRRRTRDIGDVRLELTRVRDAPDSRWQSLLALVRLATNPLVARRPASRAAGWADEWLGAEGAWAPTATEHHRPHWPASSKAS